MGRNASRDDAYRALASAAMDRSPVSGMTHTFYRYPARFSPSFAASAIEHFSNPSGVILDPYMGGGTTIVEAVARGRKTIGNDLNSLAVFIARVKTTPLTKAESRAALDWAEITLPRLNYRMAWDQTRSSAAPEGGQDRNLNLPKARFIKKAVGVALEYSEALPTGNARAFVRCAILRTAQWALDGRGTHTSVRQFLERLAPTIQEMASSLNELRAVLQTHENRIPTLLNMDSAKLFEAPPFQQNTKVDLVVTSPPYPGVHVLYHRWQVDGRKETPAPYWIAGCRDGEGAAYYNFADRRAIDAYFERSLATLCGIHSVMRKGGIIVQLIAFNRIEGQLVRYLDNMTQAGFREIAPPEQDHVWRRVPNRKWHASARQTTDSANEVVLVHEAL